VASGRSGTFPPAGRIGELSRSERSFPVVARSAAVLLAIVLLGVLGVGSSSASPGSQKEAAKDALDAAKTKLRRIQERIDRAEADLAIKAQQVDAAEARLDTTIANLLRVRDHLDETQARYDEITDRLNTRAVEVFMSGPSTSVDFLLGATSLSDLSDRFEYVSAVAQADADLAQEVHSIENLLLAQQSELETLEAQHRDDLATAEEIRDDVVAALRRAQALRQQQEQVVAESRKKYRKELREYRLSLQAVAGGGPLPAQYRDYFHNCPVDHPRSYWDGFGAPRYAGGYHLHKGVDMLAPAGTRIFAPFAGVARTSYNSLGGKVVFVDGAHGRVYNAHLSAYSSNSNGFVQAGDVIGYVGDTGDAIGTPHLHFEFHPNVIPSSWPASSYGYSVIEDAINPYPLLLYVCG
jgi:murein DD-endopeptidase MepM/ murein hydrolase activator NlpD